MEYRSKLGKVKGLGSSRSGSKSWILQRVTAIVLAILFLWFAISMAYLLKASYKEAIIWISSPLNTLLTLVFLGAAFFHAVEGLQTILEDYIHQIKARVFLIYLMKVTIYISAIFIGLAILKIAFLSSLFI